MLLEGGSDFMKRDNVAVCITAQSSSQMLIDYGADIAKQYQCSLHILHVQKGNSIFQNGETLKLLTKLLAYGGKCGGTIHVLCDEDVPKCISQFVKQQGITKVVMGEVPKELIQKQNEMQFQKIIDLLPKEIEVLTPNQEFEMELQEKIG